MALAETFNDIKKMFTPSETIETKAQLFVHALKDIYWAEQQIIPALQEMQSMAQDEEVHEMLTLHQEQTRMQVQRLEQVFELVGLEPTTETCEAMKGILTEGNKLVAMAGDEMRDVAITFASQAVEHYEIGRYTTMITWAEQLLQPKVVKLLEQNLAEETETLTELENYQIQHVSGDEAEDLEDLEANEEEDMTMTTSHTNINSPSRIKRANAQRKTTRQATARTSSEKANSGSRSKDEGTSAGNKSGTSRRSASSGRKAPSKSRTKRSTEE